MPSVTADSANIALLRFAEQSGTPSTPASGFSGIFTKSDGLYVIDDEANVTGPFGSGGVVLDPTSSTENVILPTTGDYTPLTVRGYASAQTAPLFLAKEGDAGATVFTIAGNGDVGIGITPNYLLHVNENTTSIATRTSAFTQTFAPTSATIIGTSSVYIENNYDSTSNCSGINRGVEMYVYVLDNGTVNMRGVDIAMDNQGTGTVASAIAFNAQTIYNSGTITNGFGLYVEDQTEATNNYSVYTNAGNVVFNSANSTGNMTFGTTPVSANYDLMLAGDGVLGLKETTTPTADTNYGKVYTKNDNKLYFQDGAGSEHEIAFV